MALDLVEEDFDVLEDARAGFLPRGEGLALDQFLLERALISLHFANTLSDRSNLP